MTAAETYGACGRCEQTARLTRYEVQHVHWYEPDSYSCYWCIRWPQPMLCADCTVLENAEEARRPRSVGEQRVAGFLVRGAELDEQRRAS